MPYLNTVAIIQWKYLTQLHHFRGACLVQMQTQCITRDRLGGHAGKLLPQRLLQERWFSATHHPEVFARLMTVQSSVLSVVHAVDKDLRHRHKNAPTRVDLPEQFSPSNSNNIWVLLYARTFNRKR